MRSAESAGLAVKHIRRRLRPRPSGNHRDKCLILPKNLNGVRPELEEESFRSELTFMYKAEQTGFCKIWVTLRIDCSSFSIQ